MSFISQCPAIDSTAGCQSPLRQSRTASIVFVSLYIYDLQVDGHVFWSPACKYACVYVCVFFKLFVQSLVDFLFINCHLY